MRRVLALVVFAGCAQGGASAPSDSGGGGQVDAPPQIDASMIDGAPSDATPPIDATPPVDAPPIDSPPMNPDACVPMVTELLVNPNLDNAAITPWVEIRYNAADALIVNQSVLGFNAQTPQQYVWIGGYEAPLFDTATDAVYQDVVVPPMTTQLTITGYVASASDDSPTSAYDFAALVLFLNNNPTGTAVLQINNTNSPTLSMWTPFSFNVPNPQTWSNGSVHVQMASSNDDSLGTIFLFDSLSLKATHGCP